MDTVTNDRPALLFVHGAWHGSWCWERLLPELTDEGWAVHTVDLPSAAAKGAQVFGMYDDARVIRERLDGIDGPVVIVAHSYGGIPVTQVAGEAGDVSHIIYLAALLLDEGNSMAPGDAEFPTRDGDVLLPPDDSRHLFYADVPVEEADRAVARMLPQSVRSCTEVLTRVAWKTIPSTYVVCEQDNVLAPAFQEQMASRATTVRRLLTGHSPFLSSPAEVAKLITTVIAEAAPAR
ncbi:Pimeloyl-ACP methyl ester carboxylesterase [Streptosporangium subroseum]|uniref:Pimeloyl-ACP methyl ester carboxylesterase n=1 Tax=Streptosporangium subroseum TaxID=106412 RepID=A0A239ABQ6_9ACTN|nr:alpha/beta fold hydrolase [Streptosporangium subroseum]SNR92822.1 Pimeloyl-ACP methyl ester carboxylesterase [Streptosporangium subroseum]